MPVNGFGYPYSNHAMPAARLFQPFKADVAAASANQPVLNSTFSGNSGAASFNAEPTLDLSSKVHQVVSMFSLILSGFRSSLTQNNASVPNTLAPSSVNSSPNGQLGASISGVSSSAKGATNTTAGGLAGKLADYVASLPKDKNFVELLSSLYANASQKVYANASQKAQKGQKATGKRKGKTGKTSRVPKGTKRYKAKATSYYPADNAMEGGFKDRLGKPLHTLQDFLDGKAPYVSVAMDSSAFKYGTKLRIPELEKKYGRKIIFKVVDTGGAFVGKGKKRIDICSANEKASKDPALNGNLTLIPVS